jgi:hypothetical protein
MQNMRRGPTHHLVADVLSLLVPQSTYVMSHRHPLCLAKKRRAIGMARRLMERVAGFEPATFSLGS